MFIVFGGSDTLFLGCNSSICDKIIRSYTKMQVMLRGLCLFYNFVAPLLKLHYYLYNFVVAYFVSLNIGP